jgi:hypothetical protein
MLGKEFSGLESNLSTAAQMREMQAEIERLRAAMAELLSGHDNLYVAHFGHLADPRDDIAAKAARELVQQTTAEDEK